MAAMYDFRENPNPSGDGKKQPLHPRIVSSGTIRTRRLLEEISEASTFTVGDLEGVLSALTEKISNYLVDGYHVELGNIGYFSAKLKARPVMDKKEIRSNSIYFDNVNFRASAWFKKHTRGFVERVSKYGFRSSSALSEAERKKRLEQYLDKNAFITRTAYTNITGRLKNKALNDLNLFVNQGVIERIGRGNQLLFVRTVTEK
ncbi:HU family DNA-binding protein [uncultured Bacteroides sp.]|uniref:HU family DNA-binding protein n=1 Tax=uncultured Bacteroides sp. TaxID=162156 RepID=UPI002AA61789|nr:HU family DNA-binding protein [uncultured Bacteroides sp.]